MAKDTKKSAQAPQGKGKGGKGGGQSAQDRKRDAPSFQPAPDTYEPRLRSRYREDIVPVLMERFGYSNPMQVPRLEKIVLNMGLGEAVRDPRIIELAVRDLQVVAGQKPVVTHARKSIAGFKLRAGMPIGAKVTLRGPRMWEFLDRLLSIALPRIRDFRGLNPQSFDGQGNYTMGVTEQLIFPEIEYDKIERQLGMDITCVTTARENEEGYQLLKELGFPFRARAEAQAQAQAG
ncbi:MAG TPA: 50S ribosomal protein L5 [Actinomycetota bacterium]|nr:50S ribosomal protein L5 [Actinomycetota bacterium]